MPQSVKELFDMPDFQALNQNEKIEVLKGRFPDFAALPHDEQIKYVISKNPQYQAQRKLREEIGPTLPPNFKDLPLPEKARIIRAQQPALRRQEAATSIGGGLPGSPVLPPLKELGAGIWDSVKGFFSTPESRAAHPEEHRGSGAEALRPIVDMGKSMWDSFSKVGQMPGVLKDLWNAPNMYGPIALLQVAPRAAGQYTGAELVSKGIGTLVKAPAAISEVSSKGLKGAAQEYITGTGKSAAEELARKTGKGYAEDVADVQEKNAKLKQKYEEDVKTAQGELKKAEEAHKVAQGEAAKKHAEEELAKKQQYVKQVERQARIHDRYVRRIEAANKQKLQEHAEETKRIEEVNKAEEEKVGKRTELATKIKQDSSTLGGQLKSFYAKAKAHGKELYAPVDEATEGESVPSTDVAALVTHAEDNILRGSEENIKQFNDILRRSEADPELKEDEADSRGYSYRAKLEAGEPLTFRDLQGYYEELGKKIYGPGSAELLSDVKNAMRYVRDRDWENEDEDG